MKFEVSLRTLGEDGYWYVMTPYESFEDGTEAAYRAALAVTGRLIAEGVSAQSPIVHCHQIAIAQGLDPCDMDIWRPQNRPLLEGARGGIVVRLPGWDVSKGIREEVQLLSMLKKPVIYMNPE